MSLRTGWWRAAGGGAGAGGRGTGGPGGGRRGGGRRQPTRGPGGAPVVAVTVEGRELVIRGGGCDLRAPLANPKP
ncbi:hypothetical protein [Nannocystis bainbridge]|uniref:Uncharacterized protein n=1 Tax=Nannocystis bainbridge TaxID=2995303 RepID=A0ABT5ECQ8_9BACT|nr:hypothetical protein [Nannocystis bainbridge]MDC0723223.1 hypothetical protein [Nannocystis bainbridge]